MRSKRRLTVRGRPDQGRCLTSSDGSRIEAVDDETKGDEELGQAWRELAVIGRLCNPRRCAMRLADKPCQDETKLERSLYHHPPRLEMALRWSEFSPFNIG